MGTYIVDRGVCFCKTVITTRCIAIYLFDLQFYFFFCNLLTACISAIDCTLLLEYMCLMKMLVTTCRVAAWVRLEQKNGSCAGSSKRTGRPPPSPGDKRWAATPSTSTAQCRCLRRCRRRRLLPAASQAAAARTCKKRSAAEKQSKLTSYPSQAGYEPGEMMCPFLAPIFVFLSISLISPCNVMQCDCDVARSNQAVDVQLTQASLEHVRIFSRLSKKVRSTQLTDVQCICMQQMQQPTSDLCMHEHSVTCRL